MRPLNALEARDIRALEERIVSLDSMRHSEGWKLYSAMLEQMEQQAYSAAAKAADGHEMTKHFAAFHTIRSLRSWLDSELQAARAIVQSIESQRP